MDKREENHYRMFGTTRDFLDDNTTVWSAIPKIVEYKNTFDAMYTRINELTGIAVQGVKEKKDKLTTRLGIKVSILSGALMAYANDIEDEDLAKAMKVTKSDVERCPDPKMTGLIKPLIDKARENLEALAAYGVTEEGLIEVETTLDDYNALLGKPRSIQNKIYMSIKNVSELIDKVNDLLNEKMDNIMMMFIESNPEFYEGYERARVIVDK